MRNEDLRLDAIFEWKMTNDEANAYKIAVIYQQEFARMFFNKDIFTQSFKGNSFPKKGDPRKSSLFKYCWKFQRETRGLLKEDEYRPYIIANLSIIQLNRGTIEPQCICGDKAWVRWKLHQRWMRDKLAEKASNLPKNSIITDHKLCIQIDKTKKFLFERCEGIPTIEHFINFSSDNYIKMWLLSGKISKYYFYLSPFIEKTCNKSLLFDQCGIDIALLKEKITPEIYKYFKQEFQHEH